jgi:PTH1 family peptidyl-tRNA hydrolase
VLLLKPETFMNLSGQSVGEAMRFYKLTPGDVTVFHDELDLAPGKVRVKQGGGHAGHNGLRSIHQHIGEAYGRVRLGIGHPGHKDRVAGYVLSDFAKADADWLDDVLRGVADGAPDLAAGDSGRFLNAVSLRTAPARNAKPADQRTTPTSRPNPSPSPTTALRFKNWWTGSGERYRRPRARRVPVAGQSCALLGSPFMGRLMPLIGERLTAEPPWARVSLGGRATSGPPASPCR